jgi:hypothetical protein
MTAGIDHQASLKALACLGDHDGAICVVLDGVCPTPLPGHPSRLAHTPPVLLQRCFVEKAVVDAMSNGGRAEAITEVAAGVTPAMAQQMPQTKVSHLWAPMP